VRIMENCFAVEYVPSFQEKFWKALGFERAFVDQSRIPDEKYPDLAPGSMITETVVGFTFGGRLRLLLSGKVHIYSRQKTDMMVAECVTVSESSILAPFSDR